MFSWLFPKCPVQTHDKAWTEVRMRWLADQLGIDRLLKAEVILPTEQYFPEPFQRTVEDAQRLLERLGRWMSIDISRIKLEVCPDIQMPEAAGHYQQGEQTVIRIAESQLADPLRLVATLAHELAHEILLGSGMLTAAEGDHECVTDLLPLFLGLGIFGANATVHEEHHHVGGVLSWWFMGKQGYLSAIQLGYALALFAYLRGEQKPTWATYLRLDAASALHQGLCYLRKTGDTLFHPDTIRDKRRPLTAGEVVERLQTGSASNRLAALWELENQPSTDPEVRAAVLQCLEHRDPDIPGAAARTLAVLGPPEEETIQRLLKALHARSVRTRGEAAYALGTFAQQPEVVIRPLSLLLEDEDRYVIAAAARALEGYGREAEPAAGALLTALTKAVIESDHDLIDLLADTLVTVAPELRQHVRTHFEGLDVELRRRIVEVLKEQRRHAGEGVAVDDRS